MFADGVMGEACSTLACQHATNVHDSTWRGMRMDKQRVCKTKSNKKLIQILNMEETNNHSKVESELVNSSQHSRQQPTKPTAHATVQQHTRLTAQGTDDVDLQNVVRRPTRQTYWSCRQSVSLAVATRWSRGMLRLDSLDRQCLSRELSDCSAIGIAGFLFSKIGLILTKTKVYKIERNTFW